MLYLAPNLKGYMMNKNSNNTKQQKIDFETALTLPSETKLLIPRKIILYKSCNMALNDEKDPKKRKMMANINNRLLYADKVCGYAVPGIELTVREIEYLFTERDFENGYLIQTSQSAQEPVESERQ